MLRLEVLAFLSCSEIGFYCCDLSIRLLEHIGLLSGFMVRHYRRTDCFSL